MEPIRFELTEIRPSDLSDQLLQLVGSVPGRLLRFKNAILARAEVNGNRDDVDAQGIQELAATLPLTAIDKEHGRQVIVGYYTDARAVETDGRTALACDGIIFADRYPDEAQGVQEGTYLQSIEANAKSAECSVCHKVFASQRDYCVHILNKTGNRILRGMTALGGAITRIPAGTNTKFDPSQIMLIAALAEPMQEPRLFEGAQRAAHRLMAAVDLSRANPGAHYQITSPVLAPFLWDPNEAFVEKVVTEIMRRSTVQVSAQGKTDENALEAAQKDFLSQIAALKNELNARIDELVKENGELKAALAPKPKEEAPALGIVGLGWRNDLNGGRQDQGKTKLSWG